MNLDSNQKIVCTTYVKKNEDEHHELPSAAYKNVLINGAKQIKLPEFYIDFLCSIKDNGCLITQVNIPKEFYQYS